MQKENEFIYTPASTNITVRWKKMYGYVPASEQAHYQRKWADFRAITNKTLDDVETPNLLGIVQWKKRLKF